MSYIVLYAIFTWYIANCTDNVTVTVYNPVASQCDDTPNITADGTYIENPAEQRIVAVSRDLLSKYPYGSRIYLYIAPNHPRNGYYEVHDTMHPRMKSCIDICTDVKLGKWNGVICMTY